MARLGRSVRSRLRQLLPPAYELVYDNYNFFVIGFSPSERPSEAIVSIAMQASGLSLCFLQGVGLDDPHRLLHGSGRQVRSLRVPEVALLDDPRVQALLAAAVAASPVPFRPTGRNRLIVRSVSAKQRPRRKPAAGKKQR